MNRYREPHSKAWLGWIAVATIGEFVALGTKHREYTASNALRTIFWVENKTGQAAFIGAYVALGLWLVPHILSETVVSSAKEVVKKIS